MSKQDVMDYVLNSPHNTNPAVLKSLLSGMGSDELEIVDMYICSDGEYTADGTPTLTAPSERVIYLAPLDSEGIRYASWVWTEGDW